MNEINRARTNAYGRYATNTLMKDGASINIRQQDSSRNVNTLAGHARHPVPTRRSNNSFNTAEIALYNPRSNNSLMNAEENGDMSLYTQIKNSGKAKIRTLGEDLLPNYGAKYSLNNDMDTITQNNTNVYYPHLKSSNSNKLPKDSKPTLIDERLLHHTSDKEWNYESDQIINAKNLVKSGRFKDRMARQENADRELLGMPQAMDNWSEARAGYAKRPAIPLEDIEYQMEKRLDEQRKYNSLDDQRTVSQIQKIAMSRINENLDDPNWRLISGGNDMITNRYQNNYDRYYEDVYEEAQNEKDKGILETISSTIMKLFKKDNNNKKYTDRKPKESFEDVNATAGNANPYELEKVHAVTHVIRDGTTLTSAPETLDTYGSTYISPVSRTMAMLNNGQLMIIQKFDSDAIYGSDLRPYNDDVIVTVLPSGFTEKIRDKLRNSEGRKFVEMNTQDYLQLINFITQNPSIQHRVSLQDINSLLKGDEIDQLMLQNFEGKNMIIDNDAISAYFKMNEYKRGKEETDTRYEDINDKDYKEYVDNPGYQQAQDRTDLKVRNERLQPTITTTHIEDAVNPKVETMRHINTNQLINAPKTHSFSSFSIH